MKTFRSLGVLLSLVAASAAVAAPQPRLQLRNGDYWSGSLAGPAEINVIRWQTPKTAAPLDFKPSSVGAIHFPQAGQNDQAACDLCVELLGGDVLFGSLIALDENQLKLATSQFGMVSISADAVARITSRNQLTGIEYAGPDGLDGWNEISTKAVTTGEARRVVRAALQPVLAPPAAIVSDNYQQKGWSTPAWREEAGQLVADRPGEPLSRDCSVPEKCEVEFSASWQGTGNFRMTLYVDGKEGPALPIHFQVWNRDLVMVAEGFDRADLALIKNLGDTGGRLHAILFVDRPAGRAELFSVEGLSLGQVALPPTKGSQAEKTEKDRRVLANRRGQPATRSGETNRILRERQGITIQNAGGAFRFERLVVRRWDGRLPSQGDGSQVRVVAATGDRLEATRVVFDEASAELLIATTNGETRLPLSQLASVVFPNSHATRPMAYRVTMGDATRLTGDLQIVDDATLRIDCRDVAGELLVPTDEIASIVSLADEADEDVDLRHRKGKLIAEGVHSTGSLIDAKRVDAKGGNAPRSALVWHAWGSTTPQPLARGLSGHIEYVDLKQRAFEEAKKNQTGTQPEQQVDHQVGLFGFLFGGDIGNRANRDNQRERPGGEASHVIPDGTLYLASGERIPCALAGINEVDVTFSSNVTSATVVPRDQVLMWERDPGTKLDQLDAEKRRRLFTVPRIQKNNPPTHVLESTDGDFLRARLVGCDSENFLVEVRLEQKTLPADKVRRVVWLDEVLTDKPVDDSRDEGSAVVPDRANEKSADEPNGDTRVLAIYGSSLQLALIPNELSGDELKGVSDLLGMVQIAIGEVDVLYLGDEVARQARAGKISQWQLAMAKDPKFMSEDDGGGAASGEAGLDSPLVGQAAPNFKLKTLEDESFDLSKQQGQVIVLDFFATWCGPCVQAMPQVDAVVDEFADKGVKLIAVNMQEDNESVAGLMERLKIEPTVVMDIDGATAAKYNVSAIPQTVIIGRDGKVARLFVGGGPSFAADLRAALEAVTAEK